ncbi:MAG TPA: PilZ domain-containing protein [Candidatus Acidoferrum sp.]|nr:PilZ domain-containing protein [Candidatus Acidoferrum sp.]
MDRQRRGFRFSLDAAAEMAPEGSPNATVRARVTELSLLGCYLQTPSPFPEQTHVLVKIFHCAEYFEAHASVIYVKAAAGMGVEFREMNPHCRGILQKWILAELHGQTKSEE